jgi:hypothetical protein
LQPAAEAAARAAVRARAAAARAARRARRARLRGEGREQAACQQVSTGAGDGGWDSRQRARTRLAHHGQVLLVVHLAVAVNISNAHDLVDLLFDVHVEVAKELVRRDETVLVCVDGVEGLHELIVIRTRHFQEELRVVHLAVAVNVSTGDDLVDMPCDAEVEVVKELGRRDETVVVYVETPVEELMEHIFLLLSIVEGEVLRCKVIRQSVRHVEHALTMRRGVLAPELLQRRLQRRLQRSWGGAGECKQERKQQHHLAHVLNVLSASAGEKQRW